MPVNVSGWESRSNTPPGRFAWPARLGPEGAAGGGGGGATDGGERAVGGGGGPCEAAQSKRVAELARIGAPTPDAALV